MMMLCMSEEVVGVPGIVTEQSGSTKGWPVQGTIEEVNGRPPGDSASRSRPGYRKHRSSYGG